MVPGIRAGEDVERLLLGLQGVDHGLEVRLAVVEEGADHVLAGRADGQAVGRLVVRAEAEALPDRGGLAVADPAAVFAGVPALGNGLDPIAEPTEERPVAVRVAGRGVEITAGAE